MLNQAIKLSSILFLFATLLFTSCAKDESLSENFTSDNSEEFGDKRGNRGDRGGDFRNSCFELVYPITMTMPDGTTITGDDKEALRDLIKDWYENNTDVDEKPALVYPIEVVLEDETTVTVNSAEELAALKEDCRGEYSGGHGGQGERCFSLVYPVTINFPDGTSVSVEDKDAYKSAIRTWKAENPDATDRPSLAYPVEVELEDETTVTVNSAEELAALREDCRGDYGGGHGGHHGERCFELVYPITMTMPDGTTITGEDKESLKDLIKDWYVNNPEADERPSLVFPIEVTLTEDESIVTVNSQEELVLLKEACED
jgi:uncharacterized protein YeaC (DUF1315 family)